MGEKNKDHLIEEFVKMRTLGEKFCNETYNGLSSILVALILCEELQKIPDNFPVTYLLGWKQHRKTLQDAIESPLCNDKEPLLCLIRLIDEKIDYVISLAKKETAMKEGAYEELKAHFMDAMDDEQETEDTNDAQAGNAQGSPHYKH